MQKIKEIIVVEGKDDTKRILQAVNADTFETNGSALSSADIERLKQLQRKRGLIVFTDPDFNGERIRKMIAAAIPGVKHAFIKRSEGVPTVAGGSLGVEHASVATILASLEHLYTQDTSINANTFTANDLRQAQLINGTKARSRRERLGEVLGIGYGNGKQLLKRLNLFQITPQQFNDAITLLNREDQNE
ncbi:ribonuclease M5 [Paucilactobacillus kaifaensis]|uniref:ribonuclease M5 n=1 Tax=Paucilactobacillus kaifaensis TaxID=2559921 RepID=UPI0010F4EB27|nr:ribonuclease M5 [Paucilactobacillus kaifaensis]